MARDPARPDLAAAIVAERRAVYETLTRVGPDAPTLCAGWTTRQLAAHLALGEVLGGMFSFGGRFLVGRFALRVVGANARLNRRWLSTGRARRFDWSMGRLSKRPPRLLGRSWTAPVTLCEVWVHHEDIRRARDEEPRPEEPAGLGDALAFMLRYQRAAARRAGLTFTAHNDSLTVTTGTGGSVRLNGTPGEIMLWLAGRRGESRVLWTGDAATVERLGRLSLAI